MVRKGAIHIFYFISISIEDFSQIKLNNSFFLIHFYQIYLSLGREVFRGTFSIKKGKFIEKKYTVFIDLTCTSACSVIKNFLFTSMTIGEYLERTIFKYTIVYT